MTKEEKRKEQTDPNFRNKVYEEKGKKCANCGKVNNLQIHHIVPITNGGSNKMSNLAVLCVKCHNKAHDKKTFKPQNAGRKGIQLEDHEETLHDFFNLKIGTSEAKQRIGISDTSKGTFVKLKNEYKKKYKVSHLFFNDIDIKAAQAKRMRKQ